MTEAQQTVQQTAAAAAELCSQLGAEIDNPRLPPAEVARVQAGLDEIREQAEWLMLGLLGFLDVQDTPRAAVGTAP